MSASDDNNSTSSDKGERHGGVGGKRVPLDGVHEGESGSQQDPSRIEGEDDKDDTDFGETNKKRAHADDDSSSDGSDDEFEPTGKGAAALEDDEAADLRADLGADERLGKRARRGERESVSRESGLSTTGPSEASQSLLASLKKDEQGDKQQKAEEEMIRVVTTYRFGRDDVTEEKLLPASHPDAKAFLARQAKAGDAVGQTRNGPSLSTSISTEVDDTNSKAVPSRPPPPGPRRKKGGGLAAMSAAATGKPAKINTLEKSKMDWTRFKDSDLDEHARHELDAQTKGGGSGLSSVKGYMDRRDFLDRVQNRLGDGGSSKERK